jgi:hypothetical protein
MILIAAAISGIFIGSLLTFLFVWWSLRSDSYYYGFHSYEGDGTGN